MPMIFILQNFCPLSQDGMDFVTTKATKLFLLAFMTKLNISPFVYFSDRLPVYEISQHMHQTMSTMLLQIDFLPNRI